MPNSPAAVVSLLVPTYNRADVIGRIWRSWMAQAEVAELVLVDDGSTQDYRPIVQALQAGCDAAGKRFVYLRNETRQGSPAAKNRGLQHCTQPFVLTTDDDIDLHPSMTARLLKTAAEHPNSLIGARVVYRKDGESCDDAHRRSDADTNTRYFNYDKLTVVAWLQLPEPIKVPFVTAVALWPRQLFERGLRWFEGYGGNGYREETDPQLAAQAQYGAEVWYDSHAVCYHLPPSQAYAQQSGQRRGGFFWFEYWVLRNNWVFLQRYAAWLKSTWNLSRWTALRELLQERFGPRRAGVLLRRVAARLGL